MVSMTKVKNRLKRDHPDVTPHLRNSRVNGVLMGCTGFLTWNGRTVYISTDHNHWTNTTALYRDTSDYTGGTNHFCAFDDIVDSAVRLLKGVHR